MDEIALIKDQLEKAFYGGAWHGPSVMETLENVSPGKAALKPVINAHSIWEIVLHINTWHICIQKRISGNLYDPSPEEDWPEIKDYSPGAWDNAINNMKTSLQEVIDSLILLDEKILIENIRGKDYTYYTALHGLIQHDIYHAGQIAVLKKALM